MAVRVERATGCGWMVPLARHELIRMLTAMLEAVGTAELPIELSLVNDRTIASLNRRHLNCDGPTNILTFPGAALSADQPVSAALVLSVDTLHRECLLYGQDPADHLIRLLAHGLGHALGHDHGPDMDAICRIMESTGHRALLAKSK